MKPDVYGEAEWQVEKGKEMMQGWLVKGDPDEKPTIKSEIKVEDGIGGGLQAEGQGVKRENQDDPLVEIKPVTKKKGRTLVVMGTYSIGKERIVKGELGYSFCIYARESS